MIAVRYRKRLFIRMKTVYFPNDVYTQCSDADVTLYYFSHQPPAKGFYGNTITSQWMSLEEDTEKLWSSVSNSVRRGIRRIQSIPDVSVKTIESPTVEDLQQFCDEYDQFADLKGISRADRELATEFIQESKTCIHYCIDKQLGILSGSFDLIQPDCAIGWYSFSKHLAVTDAEAKKTMADATKYIYWESILYAKAQGCKGFSMGELGDIEKDPSLEGLNNFKMSFGGIRKTLYHFYYARNLRGRILVYLLRFLKRDITGWD